jgi:hypothetical protein
MILTGGGDKNSSKAATSTNSTAGSTNSSSFVTAPVDYLGAVVQAKKSAAKTIDVSYPAPPNEKCQRAANPMSHHKTSYCAEPEYWCRRD